MFHSVRRRPQETRAPNLVSLLVAETAGAVRTRTHCSSADWSPAINFQNGQRDAEYLSRPRRCVEAGRWQCQGPSYGSLLETKTTWETLDAVRIKGGSLEAGLKSDGGRLRLLQRLLIKELCLTLR